MGSTAHDRLVVDDLLAGTGSAVILQGGAGTGKTWALQKVIAHAEATGITVLSSRLVPTEDRGANPLVDDLLPRGLLRARVDVRTAEAQAAQVIEQASGQATLIVVDDLHWAGAASLTFLAHLCRRRSGRPLAVVASLRPWPDTAARECAEWVRHGDAEVHSLAPLTPGESLELLAANPGLALDPATADAVVALCGGNPRLMCAARAAAHAAVAAAPAGQDGIVALLAGLPGGVAGLLGLPAATIPCLEAACVLGDRFRPELAAEMAGDPDAGYEAMDCLCRLGILRQGPGRSLEFAQPLVARLLYLEMSDAARVRAHARAFETISLHGFKRSAARHAVLGNLSGNRKAISVLTWVGQAELRDGALERAAGSFRAALELSSDRATPKMRMALAEALLRGGRPRAAAEVMEKMLREDEIDPRHRIKALRLLGRAFSATGQRRAASTRLREAASLAARTNPSREADSLVDHALVVLRQGRFHEARSIVDRALELSCPQGLKDDVALCDAALRAVAAEAGAVADLENQAFELLRRSPDTAGSDDRFAGMAAACAVVLAAAGRPAIADGFINAALGQLHIRGIAGTAGVLHSYKAVMSVRLGKLETAAEAAATAVAAAEQVPGDLALALAVRAFVLLHLDRVEECRQACTEAQQALSESEDGLATLWLRTVQAYQATIHGDLAAAAQMHETLVEQAEREGVLLPGISGWEAAAVVSLAASGKRDAAESLTDRLEALGDLLPHRWASMVAAAGRGLLAEADGRNEIAGGHLRRAVTLAANAGPLDEIGMMALLGSFLRRTGQGVEARRVLAASADRAVASGALMLARLAGAELSVAGARGRRKVDPGKLTPQEARVVELAASGRSNRDIARQLWISVNTVETHLQRAYAKLGVNARIQLVAIQKDENKSILA